MKKLSLTCVLIFVSLLILGCERKPSNPGTPFDNQAPETKFGPIPPYGSSHNPYKLNLEWHGNDADGTVLSYQYRVAEVDSTGQMKPEHEWKLYFNEWEETEHFTVDFKFRWGWYKIWIRAVDNDGDVDPEPDSLLFHVNGPTFDHGILLVDDDITPMPADEVVVDAWFESILVHAGYTHYEVWDYAEKFGFTRFPAFVTTPGDTDATGQDYKPLGAFSTIIWYVDTNPNKNNLSKNEETLSEYLDMGGNLCISGMEPMKSILGQSPTGDRLPSSSFAYKYLHILSADGPAGQVKILVSPPGSDYPNINTYFQSGTTLYLGNAVNQIVPLPDAEILYYIDNSEADEEFRGSPCAIKYRGPTYRVVVFGFPLIRKFVYDYVDQEASSEALQIVLEEEFEEPKN